MGLIKKLKVAGLQTLSVLGLITLAACSPALRNAQKELNETMEDKINSSEMLSNSGVSKIEKYVFLGADFEKKEDGYFVEINGIAKYDNKKNGYVNAGLNIDASKLENINNKTEKADVLNFLTNCVKEYEFEYLEVLPVENIKKLSSSVTKSIDSPLEGYNYSSGMLYGISKPEINYEEGYAVFQTKSYINFSKTETNVTYGFQGVDSKGNAKYGPIMRTKTYYEDYIHTNNIYVRASKNELKDMENNSQLAYSKFVEMYENKDKENFVIQSIEVEKSKEIDTNMREEASLDLGR